MPGLCPAAAGAATLPTAPKARAGCSCREHSRPLWTAEKERVRGAGRQSPRVRHARVRDARRARPAEPRPRPSATRKTHGVEGRRTTAAPGSLGSALPATQPPLRVATVPPPPADPAGGGGTQPHSETRPPTPRGRACSPSWRGRSWDPGRAGQPQSLRSAPGSPASHGGRLSVMILLVGEPHFVSAVHHAEL